MANSLEERLDRIEARAAVADVIHSYAQFIRYDEPERVPGLFTPDGVFETRSGHPDRPEHTVLDRREGQEQLRAYFPPMKGKLHPVPLIHNIIVIVDGDTAGSTCVMEGRIHGGPQRVYGEYRDKFRREGGRWYFSERVFTMFGEMPKI